MTDILTRLKRPLKDGMRVELIEAERREAVREIQTLRRSVGNLQRELDHHEAMSSETDDF